MTWRLARLTLDGKPGLSMVDDRFEANAPTEQLPHLAWFGVYFMMSPGGGLWDPAEEPQLDEIEGKLLRLCQVHARGWAVYVHRLDTPGIREYYLYFGDGAAMDKVLPELKAAFRRYRLEYSKIDDLKWAQYRKWLAWDAQGQRVGGERGK